MKRYLVFVFPRWGQKGGWDDLFASYEFLDNAQECLKEQLDHEYGIEMDGHIIDLHTGNKNFPSASEDGIHKAIDRFYPTLLTKKEKNHESRNQGQQLSNHHPM